MFNHPKYHAITVSGKIAVGTTTLSENLHNELGWEHTNTGIIQRKYDRKHGKNENIVGALSRSDKHEQGIDEMTKNVLRTRKNIIYEAWLAGFMSQGIAGVLKVLIICSEHAICVDRVANRENISIENAKNWMKQREEENVKVWKRLYGDYDFWDPKYFDLIIDTYKTGPNESLGMVLDKLGYKNGV